VSLNPIKKPPMTLEHEFAIVTAAAPGAWLCAAGSRALGFEHHVFGTPMLADLGT